MYDKKATLIIIIIIINVSREWHRVCRFMGVSIRLNVKQT